MNGVDGMKKTILLILIAIILLGILFHSATSYQFPNQSEKIISIELLYNHNKYGEGTDYQNIDLVRELQDNEISKFMDEVYSLETKKYHPPLWGWGSYIAKVTYANGNVEMLGSLNIEEIISGETPTGYGSYYFPDDSFVEVFAKYVDIADYPSCD